MDIRSPDKGILLPIDSPACAFFADQQQNALLSVDCFSGQNVCLGHGFAQLWRALSSFIATKKCLILQKLG